MAIDGRVSRTSAPPDVKAGEGRQRPGARQSRKIDALATGEPCCPYRRNIGGG